jgi:succinate dehydrogenase/fumarate reductase flavoprotein subunit
MGEAKRRGTFEQRKSNPTNLSKSFAVDKDRLTEVLDILHKENTPECDAIVSEMAKTMKRDSRTNGIILNPKVMQKAFDKFQEITARKDVENGVISV